MKFLIVAALALSAVCAEEAKKTEKRGLSSLGYGGAYDSLGYGGVGYGGLGYGGLGYSGAGLGYGGYASPVVSKVAYSTTHGGYGGLGGYGGYGGLGGYSGYGGYNNLGYSGLGGYGAGYGHYPAVSYANQVSYPGYGYNQGYSSGLGYGGYGSHYGHY